MGDGAPISQEIKLPTDSAELGKAVDKLDKLIASLAKSGSAAKEHGEKHRTEAYKLRHEFGEMGHAAAYAKTEIKELLEFTGILEGIELMKELAEKVVDIGKEAIVSAAAAERMNRVIDNASGGKIAGKENRDWLEEFSRKTEFTEAQGEGAFVDLKKSGTTDQQAKLAIKAAADIAAVSKNKDEAFGTAIEAFQRLQSMGRIGARQLMPLGLGVADFKTLDRFKGQSDKAIRAAMEGGKIDKNELFQLIMARTGEKAIGEKAAANADLLGTKLSKLAELPERFYKKLADTKALNDLTKGLDSILQKLDPESPKGKQISEFFEKALEEGAKVAGELGDAIDQIDFDGMADTLKTDVVPAIEKMISLIGPAVRLIDKTLTGLHEGARLLTDPLGVARDVATGQITKSAHQQLADKGALPSMQEHSLASDLSGNTFLDKWTPLGYLHDTVFNPDWWSTKAKAMPDGVAAGIEAGTPEVAKASAEMGEASHDAFMSPAGIDAHSPSRKFHYGGQMAAEGVATGFESKADRIANAMTTTLGPRVSGVGSRTATGGGGVHLTIAEGAIPIHVNGGTGDIGGQVREELTRALVPALIDALESAQDGR